MKDDVRLIDANALKEYLGCDNDRKYSSMIMHEIADRIDEQPTIDAVPVVRCRDCKNGAPLPEEARDEFSPGVMRCLAGRGDCDKYCTTWEDGFCDEGAKMDAKEDNHAAD